MFREKWDSTMVASLRGSCVRGQILAHKAISENALFEIESFRSSTARLRWWDQVAAQRG